MRFRNEHGRVILDGIAEKTVGIAVVETALTLPAGFRPAYKQIYPLLPLGHGIEIDTDGTLDVVIDGGAVADELHLEGISFVADIP